jgi:hypothetical protein
MTPRKSTSVTGAPGQPVASNSSLISFLLNLTHTTRSDLYAGVQRNTFTRAFDHWFCAIARRIPFWTLLVLLILSLFSRLWLMLEK